MMKLIDAPLSHSIDVAKYILTLQARNKSSSKGEIINYFGKTSWYTERAINFLNFVHLTVEETDKIILPQSIYKKIKGKPHSIKLEIKKNLIKFKPFIEYHYFFDNGKSPIESAKLVKNIYDIKNKPKTIKKIFDKWTEYFKYKSESKESISKNELKNLEIKLNNDFNIHKFLRDKLGNFFKFLPDEVIEDLSEASLNFKKYPRKSINDAGRALEDFLRKEFAKEVDLSSCSGLIQIANELYRNEITAKKHNGVIVGLGNIRSMGDAHGVDKDENVRWNLSSDTALYFLLLIVNLINSLFEYRENKILIF